MKNKYLKIVVLISLIFCLCSCNKSEPKSKTFYTYFDTVITVYSYANESQKTFDSNCAKIEQLYSQYNRYFDIYHEYAGLNNLCTVNKNAGQPVSVNSDIMELLKLAKEYYQVTKGETNIMMGSVLQLWNKTINETHQVPSFEELQEASNHCNIDSLILNEEKGTVQINDTKASIDVGAIAKGYATEQVAQYLLKNGIDHYVINAGGNVRLVGTKPQKKDWKVAIRNPKNELGYSKILKLNNTSCVTSGIYERNVVINGDEYHHIIDKDTLYPAKYFESVSVICPDSAYADALSTALSCMSLEDGKHLAQVLDDFEVLWTFSDGLIETTEGLRQYIDEE